MLGRASFVVLLVALMPATVQAFDHHHIDHHTSGGSGCGSSTSSSSTTSTPTPSPSVDPAPPAADHKRVFVTSTTYSGAPGSVLAADAACQHQADASGLPGVFRAWISNGKADAYVRMSDGPWYTTADALAFSSHAELRNAPQAELLDEAGGYPQNAGAWTGSDVNGTSVPDNCEAWTNATAAATGMTGSALGFDATWGGGHAPMRCDQKAALLCFQQ
jgi:hypothetical protein